MGGGGGSSTNTIQNSSPWGGVQPFLTGALNEADSLWRKPMPSYEGVRTAPMNNMQTDAMQMQADRARQGSSVMNAAQQLNADQLSGKYLSANAGANPYTGLLTGGTNPYAGANPYLDKAIQQTQDDTVRAYQQGTAASLDRAAAQANAFGSSGYQQAVGENQYSLAKALGGISNNARMADYTQQQQLAESGLNRSLLAQQGNAQLAESGLNRNLNLYNSERQRQQQGMLFAPQQAEADYTDAMKLASVGDIRQGYDQQLINDQIARWQEQALSPYRNLEWFQQMTSGFGGYGGSSSGSTTASGASSPYAGALGGAALGYAAGPAVASMLGYGGGAAAGAAGAAGGASAGASSGSMAGPYGALIGAGLGYLLSQ